MKKFLLLTTGLFVFSCATKEEVDLIVTNANIYTVDADFSKASSMAIKDGKFVAVGETGEISKKYNAQENLDAQGRTIVPGLIDAHCHFYGLGQNQQVVDLVGTQSFDEVLERVVAFQKERQSNFIQGRGWDQNDWEVKEFPTKDIGIAIAIWNHIDTFRLHQSTDIIGFTGCLIRQHHPLNPLLEAKQTGTGGRLLT